MKTPDAGTDVRPFGHTGRSLPSVGFGCMGLVGWYGLRDDDEARQTLLSAIDRGVVHLDTASSYQNGANERFVGGVIGSLGSRRAQLFVASKFGITRGAGGEVVVENSPKSLRSAVDLSLKNLALERIDLYYLHRIDTRVSIEDSVGALAELIRYGKIGAIGLSECSIETLQRAHAVHPISAVQSEYSLWSRDPERGMLAACAALGVAFVAYSPLGRGFLAGNFRTADELPPDDARRTNPRFCGDNVLHNQRLAEAVRAFALRKNCSPSQLAIAWVLAAGPQLFTIPGMKRRTHLDDNLGALSVRLSPSERDELSALIEGVGIRGDRHPPAMMAVVDR